MILGTVVWIPSMNNIRGIQEDAKPACVEFHLVDGLLAHVTQLQTFIINSRYILAEFNGIIYDVTHVDSKYDKEFRQAIQDYKDEMMHNFLENIWH